MSQTPAVLKLVLVLWVGGSFFFCQRADAVFHFMQIEQVIGGVNGDPNAQAIQLRMRSAGQNQMQLSRLYAWDATGDNPVLLVDMTTSVANGLGGDRVLITTPQFATYTTPSVVRDFTMAPIPTSYLAAGRITFEDDVGTIFWSLAWGGANYTGSTLGTTNDNDDNFGPPVSGPLPSTSTSALLINRTFSQVSTTNLANYGLTPGAATFTNNARNAFLVTIPSPPDPNSADFDGDDDVDGIDFLTWQRNAGGAGTFAQGDANHDGNVDEEDLAIWEGQYGTDPPFPLSSVIAVPEPNAAILLVYTLLAVGRRRP